MEIFYGKSARYVIRHNSQRYKEVELLAIGFAGKMHSAADEISAFIVKIIA